MPSWALVVGVDRYAVPAMSLKGAVRDALSMLDWLTHSQPALVDPGRIKVLLSLTPSSAQPPTALNFAEATKLNLIRAIKDLGGKAAFPGDRLFVYFSGHGLNAPGLLGGDAILPSDFTNDDTTVAMSLRGLLEFFKISQFNEQYFFIDACRNVPFEDNFNISPFPLTPDPSQMRPEVEQWVLAATSRGVKANEDQSRANDERGVFTEALISGLKGTGVAKFFDVSDLTYKVTPERLLRYLVDQVRKKVASLHLTEPGRFVQTPTLSGEHFSSPVLAVFPEAAIPPVHLTFNLAPPEVTHSAILQLWRDALAQTVGPPVSSVSPARVLQREYRIVASAAGFQDFVGKVEAFEDMSLPVDLIVAQAAATAATASPGGTPRGLDATTLLQAQPPPTLTGSLEARTDDSLSLLQVLDTSGKIMAKGRGELVLLDLKAGLYTVRMLTPDGRVVENAAFVSPGASETIFLPAPPLPDTHGLSELIRAGTFAESHPAGNVLRIGERLGAPAVAFAKASTVLAMAAAIAVESLAVLPEARRLFSLGLTAARNAVKPRSISAVQLLLADETAAEAGPLNIDTLRLRIWSINQRVPSTWSRTRRSAQLSSVAEYAKAVQPGAYILAVSMPNGPQQLLLFPALAGRISTLIIHRNQRNILKAFYFFSRLRGADAGEVLLQRRLEAAQRFYQTGRLEAVIDLLEPGADPSQVTTGNRTENEILASGTDPMVELLGGYCALQLTHSLSRVRSQDATTYTDRLVIMASRFSQRFPALSDAHLLAAEVALLRGNREAAVAACRSSLDRGLPLFDYGLRRLWILTRELQLDHPRLDLLNRIVKKRLSGSPWTVWVEEDLKAGENL